MKLVLDDVSEAKSDNSPPNKKTMSPEDNIIVTNIIWYDIKYLHENMIEKYDQRED